MPAAASRFADLDGATLHYREAGEGDVVVLVHGIPQTSHEWRHVMPRLAEHYRVIAPDLRGLGDSSRPAGGYDKKTLADDLWQLVRGHLGVERFFLVGHDWGGPVAFSLAAQHPDAVRRLAILDVVIPGDGGDFSQGGRRWHHAFFRTLDLPEALCHGREELVVGWLFDNYGHRPNCIGPEDQREYFRTYTTVGAFRAMLAFYRALPVDAEDNRAILARNGKLRMPVLALGGEKSFGRGMECIESLRRVAEDVRGGLVKECGHWIPEEQPEVLRDELMRFFAEDAG
ncbi:Soluble epoxide hydrolase [Methylobacterium crusticola]|uniref:Soluble epoxide hydrolase n=1 Tax=Methylobacterium crusticola TaxID=1697972 RepID=A0ABQ4R2Y4_9HYPH|nr:alpha/beta fold hydrolase [Methylobacterium crusticola]GJD51229.1 Soluble epoxide hydrolase [Methylobacterium crusticola]